MEKIFVACVGCCCGQKWLLVVTNFEELLVDETEEDVVELVINGWTSVTRFFDKNTDWFGLVEMDFSFVDISFVAEIVTLLNVWIFGEVVPGGIKVNNDEEEEFEGFVTVVVLLCCGLRM